MSSGDEKASRHTHHTHKPMTKLTRFVNGKVSNKALNLLANTTGMVATAVTLTSALALGAAVIAPQSAEASFSNYRINGQNISCFDYGHTVSCR